MADDLKDRGPADRARVNVNEPWELDYWSKNWGVSPDKVRDAVRAVGVMAADVAKQLGKSA